MSPHLPSSPPPDCPRGLFTALALRRDEEIDLAEGALLISAEENPGLDVRRWLAYLDELAAEAAPLVAAAGSTAGGGSDLARLDALRGFLFEDQGFRGEREHYGDPANSFLDRVLERRAGIPITLATVMLEVARRIGLPLLGVGLPGHFLVRHALHPAVLLDPFDGRFVSHHDCQAMIARLGDGRLPFHPRLLAPVTTRAMLHRLLNNLRAVHFARGDMERTLGALDRMLLLFPDDAVHLRERGLHHLHRGDLVAALEDLTRYIAVEPEAPDRDAVHALLAMGRQRLSVVH
jgi:regulator of sirC expression with transglutaminase-like and TPR domain